MNNYDFWEEYLKKVKNKIIDLCDKKVELQIDLHIHSNYSADGKQTIQQIIESTKRKGFDIIAITDHDSLDAYNEIFEIVKNKLTDPLIIPGVEFTIDNKEYGNQCHMLQLFVNPKDTLILNDVRKNYDATYNRSKLQFKRIAQNKALQAIFKEKKITVSYDEYVEYLKNTKLFPEYDTLCSYLMEKFIDSKTTTFDVLERLEKTNVGDIYEDRKMYKSKRYKELKEKYEITEDNKKSVRFLLSMLAVREVDDDWWDNPPCGSLSVNSYGQISIGDLNDKYGTYFAHPTESSLDVVEQIVNNNKTIIGMEHNIRNNYININTFNDILNKYKLNKIIGSDSHDNTMQFYDDLNFYKIKSVDLKKMLNK